MKRPQWLRAFNYRPATPPRTARTRRLQIETLEDRTVPDGQPVALSGTDGTPVTKADLEDGPPLLTAPEMPAFAKLDTAIVGAIQHAWQVAKGTKTSEWLIQLPGGQSPDVLQSIGAVSVQAVPYWANAHAVTFAEVQDVASFPARLASVTESEFYYPLVRQQLQPRFVPNDTLFPSQWHLRNTGQSGGTPGQDANLVAAWDLLDATNQPVRGDGVVIGIVDDGLQHSHPDLSASYVAAHSYDFNNDDPDPMPGSTDAHGTAVAGVAAGSGHNSIGVAGSALSASLAGLRLISAPSTDSQEAAALTYHMQDIDIYSNSWGPIDNGTLGFIGPQTLAALRNGVTNGRGGLGNIYTWAAGNGLANRDNVNYDAYANSRFVIAVGAIDHRGIQSSYSEPGAPMLVTAYSSGAGVGITTTDLMGSNGYNGLADNNYTNQFGGTSSATPLVSGVIALMLDANPNLTYRDVQNILVETARKNHPSDPGWTLNAAGHDINHKYGFGAIDAHAAVSLAKTWTTLEPEIFADSGTIDANLLIPDNNATGVTSTFHMTDDLKIEHVEIIFNSIHTYRGDLEIIVTAPSGTQSVLAEQHTDSGDNHTNWVFSSVRHWGESAAGTWTIKVADKFAADVGTFLNWSIRVYGTPSNSPPVLSNIESTQIDYVVGQGELVVTNALTVADDDSATMSGATVAISANYISGQDFLRFPGQGSISGAFDSGTGILTLTGTGTVAEYQTALRSVRYENTSATPNTSVRTVRFEVTDQGGLASNAQTRDIDIIPINEPPTLDPISDPAPINEDAGTQVVNLTGISAGPGENQDLIVTATSDNPGVIPNPTVNYTSPESTGSLSFAPALNQYGSATITVKVKDSGGTVGGGIDEVTRTFTVVVLSSNDAPTFTKGPDQYVYVNAGPQTVSGWATGMSAGPPDEAGQELSFIISNDNNSLFAVQPTVALDGTLTYTPASGAAGSANVSIALKDNGGTANGGSDTSAAQTLFINVELNDAPALDGNVVRRLTPIPRGKVNPAGDTVAFMVGNTITDPDPFPAKGVAIVGLTETGNGSWEYSLNAGVTWIPFGVVSPAAARLLRSQDMVRFVPTSATFIGSPEISYHAWDQTTGAAGDLVDLTTPGATGNRTAFSVGSATARGRVAPVMTPIAENAKINRGEVVLRLAGPFIQDADPRAKRGIAVSALTGDSLGTWQFSTNGGITWKPVGSVGPDNALLLRDRDRIRFMADANQFGEASFYYHAWDQTRGLFGQVIDLTATDATGGAAAVSPQGDTIFAEVYDINNRPVLDKAWQPTVGTVAPNNTDPPGTPVGEFIGSAITDSDSADPRGIAIVGGTNVGGKWQYKLDGSASWTDIGQRNPISGLLLRAEDRVRFLPDGFTIGTPTFRFKAWDQSSGEAGDLADTRRDLAFSIVTQTAQVIVFNGQTPANTPPTLNAAATPQTTPAAEDTAPSGDQVASLLQRATTDPDVGALKGIAIVGAAGTANGRWQYSTTGGLKWLDVPRVSQSHAFLLRDIDWVRFLPNKDFTGDVELTLHAWDQTQGSVGQLADLTLPGTTGGKSAFSTASDVATFTITPVNDAPILDRTQTGLFTLQAPNNPDPPGDLVATIIGTSISEVDAAAPKGIGITKYTIGGGTWEYRLSGTNTWKAIPDAKTLSVASPFLLKANDRIRFRADTGFVGTRSIWFKAWDQSAGAAGTIFSGAIGSTALSKAVGMSVLTVATGNNRPILNPKAVNQFTTVLPNATNPPGDTVANLLGNAVVDLDATNLQGLALTFAPATRGRWEFSTDGGTTWRTVDIVSTKSALLLRSQDLLRFIPNAGFIGTARAMFYAWDQTSGAAGDRVNIFAPGTTAFSKARALSAVTMNTAPVLNV